MRTVENCTFCQTEALEPRRLSDPSDELIISFLSDPRMTEGHALIVPRRHIEPGKGGNRLNDAEAAAIEHEIERLRSRMLGSVAMRGGVDIFRKQGQKCLKDIMELRWTIGTSTFYRVNLAMSCIKGELYGAIWDASFPWLLMRLQECKQY